MTTYTDILYEEKAGVARIAINRPEKYNAFRGKTCDEMIDALQRGAWNKAIGVIVLTGTGDKAFCTGGDQTAHDGGYDGRGMIGLPVEELQGLIRDAPKPEKTGFATCSSSEPDPTPSRIIAASSGITVTATWISLSLRQKWLRI